MIDRRLPGARVDELLAGDRIDHGRLHVVERGVARLQAVTMENQAARRDPGVLRAEAALALLLQHVGVQADLALVARRGREQVSRASTVPYRRWFRTS